MNVTLIASPFANLGNIHRALQSAGGEVVVTVDPELIGDGGCVVLPGVGSFAPAARWMRESGVAPALRSARDRGAHILGICVGHQLLFESSEEGGGEDGLGFIGGTVRRLETSLPVPQIGWNRVELRPDPLFAGVDSGTSFYFVHSYHAVDLADESRIATADYGGSYVVAARNGRVAGLQFHPERSSTAGITVLRNFIERASGDAEANDSEVLVSAGDAWTRERASEA